MKKFDMPVMEVAKFDADDVVTTSGGFDKTDTRGYAWSRLESNGVEWNDVMSFTF